MTVAVFEAIGNDCPFNVPELNLMNLFFSSFTVQDWPLSVAVAGPLELPTALAVNVPEVVPVVSVGVLIVPVTDNVTPPTIVKSVRVMLRGAAYAPAATEIVALWRRVFGNLFRAPSTVRHAAPEDVQGLLSLPVVLT